MNKKKNFITSIKDNLAENIIGLLSLIINIFSSGLILGLILTAVFIFIERILSNITKKKYIGLIVQMVLTIIVAIIQIYQFNLAGELRMR